ncbi:Crp/Fnr family transcriptional regulator [Micromonospora sp. WMMD998]|uniref:Crp/Fnr family transcriptional regulator n=1 Tax=Micromonospora sp. WMMD998 TaxID=3016092 RepID=UPI00249A3BBE|nr:Crp/Fnr family transcriptional regulator [Micromonospora sp. WMMD998]WFE39359.1 Crp/Fnr family transcriptional regulator [Micromonospora sp. WMMD998]
MRDEVLRLGVLRRYPAGTVLIQQGSSSREALLLLHGYVKVFVNSGDHAVLLTVRSQGDVVGDLAAVSGQARSATVTACTHVVARFILPETLREFLARHRHANERLNALVVEQLTGANRRRAEFATLPVVERLARVIGELAGICGDRRPDGSVRLPPWFSQAELADLVGASADSVQRALRVLRRRALIDTGYRSLTIRDPAQLAAVRSDSDVGPDPR